MNLTFDQFLETAERFDITNGARLLLIDERFFEGDNEIIVFESDCYITRRGKKYSALVYHDEYLGDYDDAARFLYFEYYVWECATHSQTLLIQFYQDWLQWQKLPEMCALDLLMGAELTPSQRRWLDGFVSLWDKVVE